MRCLLCMTMVSLLALTANAGDEPFPDTAKIEAELKQLDEMPVAVEYHAVSKEMTDIREEEQKRAAEAYKKSEKVRESQEYREYETKRSALQSKRSEAWEVERKKIAEAAKKIYAARHEEIRKVARAELPEAMKLNLTVLSYPRVDGSTSTGPLSVMMACRILGIPYEWIYPEPTGYPWSNRPDVSMYFLPAAASMREYNPRDFEFLLATLKVVAKPAQRDQERIALLINSVLAASTTTHDAYVNLVNGKSDLNLAARPPSESELKLAKEKGVTIRLEPIARDAFVFLVNRKNTVKGITRQQARDIYEEKIKDWSEVGGEKGVIRAFRRERDSGSRELFDALVLQGKQLAEGERHNPLYADSMGGPYSQVTQREDGLGYSIYYYEHFMAASAFTRTLAVDGVEPTAETIAAGTYPWVTQIYVTYREGERADSPAMKLVKWMTSTEGQAVVKESGYVPRQEEGAEKPSH